MSSTMRTIPIGAPLDLILVDRLKEVYWGPRPESWTEASVRRAEPQAAYLDPDLRTPEWDLGRVHHFVQLLEARKWLDPIVTDSRVYGPYSWGPPFVWDGHHRFVAAVLVRRRRILASCGGLVSSIEWLTGQRRRRDRPSEITG